MDTPVFFAAQRYNSMLSAIYSTKNSQLIDEQSLGDILRIAAIQTPADRTADDYEQALQRTMEYLQNHFKHVADHVEKAMNEKASGRSPSL